MKPTVRVLTLDGSTLQVCRPFEHAVTQMFLCGLGGALFTCCRPEDPQRVGRTEFIVKFERA